MSGLLTIGCGRLEQSRMVFQAVTSKAFRTAMLTPLARGSISTIVTTFDIVLFCPPLQPGLSLGPLFPPFDFPFPFAALLNWGLLTWAFGFGDAAGAADFFC